METLRPGVWGIVATPFDADTLALDGPSLRSLVQAYRSLADAEESKPAQERIVSGVVALGVFGEASRLDAGERVAVVEQVLEAAGSLDVVVGIAFAEPSLALAEAELIARSHPGRVRAVMVQINDADPEVLARHLSTVHEACGLPIVVQDYPANTGVRITSAALANAVNTLSFVVAVKSESPPTSTAIAQLAPVIGNVPVFGGLGGVGLLDELYAGSAGAMTGFSYPEGLVAIVSAWRNGGFSAARDEIARWLPLMNFEGQAVIGLGIRKENLRLRGVIASAVVRSPGVPFPAELASCAVEHRQALTALGYA